ncbi:hypothetical protein MHYP_G00139850 [Metynnis hypsauchen]
MLAFMVGEKIPQDDKVWQLLMTLKDIVELVMAPVHTDQSIGYLDSKIGEHRLIKALVKATRMSLPAQLRVIIEQHDVRKLTLTSGIPDSVEELLSVIMERFQLQGNFGLMYQDKDFGKYFFTMTTTADVKDKDTVKLVQTEPTVILNLTTVDESEVDISSVQSDQSITPVSGDHYSADDSGSCSSRDTVLLPATCRSEPWPAKF